ncbi:MAG: hypothetical protein KF709_14715 [Gemmatimonadaceae bacterium]|nr:hypothetical protein [Gemmatimonadaceae bacterium]
MRPDSTSSALRAALLACAALAVFSAACGGREASDSEQPWTVTVDSTGDTIRVHIAGTVPPSYVHSLVPELRVGSLDGGEEETFGQIEAVFGLGDGGLLVYDGQAQALRMFDSTGAFVRRVGGKGGGPGEHGHVNGIARLPGGRWALWDAQGARVNFYGPDGSFERNMSLQLSGWFLQDGLRAGRAGDLYAWSVLETSATEFRILRAGYVRVDADGAASDTLEMPKWGIPEAVLSARSADGGSASASQVPWFPSSQVTFDPAGGLISAPGAPDYVWYRLIAAAKPLRVDVDYEPVPVGATERAERRAQIEHTMRRLNPSWNWTGPAIPDVKPAVRDLAAGEDGRIWVRLYTPEEPIPEAELPVIPAGANPRPRRTTREPDLWDVFAPDGRLLGRVRPPPGTSLLSFSGNHVWASMRDSLDVPYAVRLRIEPALPR